MRGLAAILALAGCDKVFSITPIDISTVPFDPPVALTSLNTPMEEDRPTLTDDLLEIYFHHERAIWTARRSRVDAAFDPPTVVAELRGGLQTIRACVSGDGLRIYVSREAGAAQPARLHVATRGSRDEAWSAPALIEELAISFPDDDVFCGWEDATAMLISFGSGTEQDIARITRATPGGPFVNIAPLPALNSAARENAPWANEDGSLVVFERRTGTQVDLQQATLQAGSYAVRPLAELQFDASGSPWLSKDGRTIVFVHDDDLWMATR